METDLIAGYLAYTTADEFGADASGDAPASTPSIGVSIASFSLSVQTVNGHC